MAKTAKPVDFEKTLAQLESIVEKMENGELSLEESLQAFETGVKLTRECQNALASAEQKVQLLMEQHGQPAATPFQADEDIE